VGTLSGSFTDSNSDYSYNVGLTGGVYDVSPSSSVSTVTMTLTSNDYLYNYGGTGGVLKLNDQLTLTITSCTFKYNYGSKGGVIYYIESTTQSDFASATVKSSTFYNNTAETGGAFYLSQPFLSFSSSSNDYQYQWAAQGGVIYISDLYNLDLSSDAF